MWLSLLRLLLQLASTVATHLRERRLLEAGAAQAVLKGVRDADEAIARARAARDAVRDDPDSVRDDPYNRDGWK